MGIYRCNQCGFVSEDAVSAVGARVPCGKCGTASTVYGTVFYVEKLVERYFAALREVAALKEAETPTDAATTPTTAASPGPLTGDAFNTDALATAAQHQPLQAWLATRQIQASFDFRAVDTTGFFDEAAKAIGDGYELFAELIERVRSAYRKSFSALNLELGGLSQKDAQAVNNLCRKLHSYTFFSRYVYQKPEKIVRLNLQQAPAVRLFFEGGWLEWYAFIELLTLVQGRGRGFSCAGCPGHVPQRRPPRAGCGLPAGRPAADLHRVQIGRVPSGHRKVPAAQAPAGHRTGPFHRLCHRFDRCAGGRAQQHVRPHLRQSGLAEDPSADASLRRPPGCQVRAILGSMMAVKGAD